MYAFFDLDAQSSRLYIISIYCCQRIRDLLTSFSKFIITFSCLEQKLMVLLLAFQSGNGDSEYSIGAKRTKRDTKGNYDSSGKFWPVNSVCIDLYPWLPLTWMFLSLWNKVFLGQYKWRLLWNSKLIWGHWIYNLKHVISFKCFWSTFKFVDEATCCVLWIHRNSKIHKG